LTVGILAPLHNHFFTVSGQLPPGQLPPRTIATQDNCHPDNCHLGQLSPSTIATQDNCYSDNCHLGQLPPRTSATQDNYHPDNCHPRGFVGREHVPTLFQVFLCSAMKVNRSLKTDSKISLKCCWNSLVFYVRFHTSFFSTTPCATRTTPT